MITYNRAHIQRLIVEAALPGDTEEQAIQRLIERTKAERARFGPTEIDPDLRHLRDLIEIRLRDINAYRLDSKDACSAVSEVSESPNLEGCSP